MEIVIPILAAAVRSGTPILYATLGEIVTEKSGVMNLGLEGLMLLGALSGFVVTSATGTPWLGVAIAFGVGAFFSLIHAAVCVSLGGNQVVSGLALTMLGTGVSAIMGREYIGQTIVGLTKRPIPGLAQIPLIGPVFFDHDPLVYFSYGLVLFLCWFFWRTRAGLNLRAVGDSPQAADSVGLSVVLIRYVYTVIGGGIVAIGGAYLSISYSHMWTEGMSAGRGWIAVALVIFAIWNPARAAFGSYLFGGVEACQLRIQAAGTNIPAPLLLMLPYVLTIIVLLVISIRKGQGILFGAPAALGTPFYREER
ncbi:MAG: ABC transporter permease [Dethiosulfovibrio peptidovorans]|nr:MAG: ABC transporter permease [Dethiosulfovibrio peptidovorans]